EPLHRLVRDGDPAVAVGERDPVHGPVDEASQQYRVALEFALTFLPSCDVDDEALPIRTRSISDTRRGVAYPDRSPVRGDEPVLAVEGTTRGNCSRVVGEDPLAVARVNSVPPQVVIVEPGSGRITHHRLDLRANVGQSAGVFGVHRQRKTFDEAATPSLSVAQGLSGEPDPEADQQEACESS